MDWGHAHGDMPGSGGAVGWGEQRPADMHIWDRRSAWPNSWRDGQPEHFKAIYRSDTPCRSQALAFLGDSLGNIEISIWEKNLMFSSREYCPGQSTLSMRFTPAKLALVDLSAITKGWHKPESGFTCKSCKLCGCPTAACFLCRWPCRLYEVLSNWDSVILLQ